MNTNLGRVPDKARGVSISSQFALKSMDATIGLGTVSHLRSEKKCISYEYYKTVVIPLGQVTTDSNAYRETWLI